MTLVSVVIGATDVSSDVMRIEAWPQATLGVVRFKITLRDTGGTYDNTIAADSGVTITLNNAVFWKGYVDIVLPNVAQDEQHRFFETVEIMGRNYGQDTMNKFWDGVQYDHADNIINKILVQSSCEVWINNNGSGPQIYYDDKASYDSDAIREILEQINYDGYVGNDKQLNIYPIGTVSSGITLKSVADASDNNIIRVISHTEKDALDLWNYIVALGDKVNDSWTEKNASDWTAAFSGNSVSDYTSTSAPLPAAGLYAIRIDRGSATYTGAKLTFPRYSHSSLDFSNTASAEIAFSAWQYIATGTITRVAIELTDTSGNRIRWWPGGNQPYDAVLGYLWDQITISVGWKVKINSSGLDIFGNQIYNGWYQVQGSSFNWNIAAISVSTTQQNILWILIDALKIPVQLIAVSDYTGVSPYKVRKLPLSRPDIETQKELQQFADSIGGKTSQPIEKLSLVARGDIGLIGGVWRWLPRYSVTVNIPAKGINSVSFRFINIHHIIERHVEFGFDHAVELDMIPASQQLDMQRWTYANDPQIGILRKLRDRLRYFEQKDIEVRDFYPGLPVPIWQLYGQFPFESLDSNVPWFVSFANQHYYLNLEDVGGGLTVYQTGWEHTATRKTGLQ